MAKKKNKVDEPEILEALVGYTDKDGKSHWEKVDANWREVRPGRKRPRKAS